MCHKLFFATIALLLFSCSRKTTYYVENRSERDFDSVQFSFNRKVISIANVQRGNIKMRIVSRDSASATGHLNIYVQIFGGRPAFYGSDYNTFYGGTFSKVGLIIDNDSSARLMLE
jgi:hypothetical protein